MRHQPLRLQANILFCANGPVKTAHLQQKCWFWELSAGVKSYAQGWPNRKRTKSTICSGDSRPDKSKSKNKFRNPTHEWAGWWLCKSRGCAIRDVPFV